MMSDSLPAEYFFIHIPGGVTRIRVPGLWQKTVITIAQSSGLIVEGYSISYGYIPGPATVIEVCPVILEIILRIAKEEGWEE